MVTVITPVIVLVSNNHLKLYRKRLKKLIGLICFWQATVCATGVISSALPWISAGEDFTGSTSDLKSSASSSSSRFCAVFTLLPIIFICSAMTEYGTCATYSGSVGLNMLKQHFCFCSSPTYCFCSYPMCPPFTGSLEQMRNSMKNSEKSNFPDLK